jgi:hypothetical protein
MRNHSKPIRSLHVPADDHPESHDLALGAPRIQTAQNGREADWPLRQMHVKHWPKHSSFPKLSYFQMMNGACATQTSDSPTYSVKQAAQSLRLSRNSVYQAGLRGQIPCVEVSKRIFNLPRAPDRDFGASRSHCLGSFMQNE